MHAIVTGATGFVGKSLVSQLLEDKKKVTVIVRDKKKVPAEWLDHVSIIECSLDNLKNLSIVNMEPADTFYHFAWSGTSGMERADVTLQLKNVENTVDAVRLAKKLNCTRFVNAGSIMEYEAVKYATADEEKLGMGNIYSTAKLSADFMAKIVATKEEIAYINVIISNIFGVGEKSDRFLNTTLKKMLRNEIIPLTHGNQIYDFIYVSDAIKAIVLAGECGKANCSYYIGNDQQYPLKEFVLKMKEILKSSSELQFGKVPLNAETLNYKEFDTAKLARLGFRPQITFEEGIRKTTEWMVENNYV